MSVDVNKVLHGNPMKSLRIKHRELTQLPSITREAARNYYDAYADKPMKFTLEASRFIFSEPLCGLKYYKEYVENHTIPLFALRTEATKVSDFVDQFGKRMTPRTLMKYESVRDYLNDKVAGLKHTILLSESADKSEEMKDRIFAMYENGIESVDDTIQTSDSSSSSSSNDSSSSSSAPEKKSVISNFYNKAKSNATETTTEDSENDIGKSTAELDKEAQNIEKNSNASVMDESVCLEAAFPDIMYYMLEHDMSLEISKLMDWHFSMNPQSLRAIKEDADVVLMTKAMLGDSYISEKVENLSSPSVSRTICQIAAVDPQEFISEIRTESGDRDSVHYLDPLQAFNSMSLDKIITEAVNNDVDKVYRKLCLAAVKESVINYKTILESADDDDDDMDIEDLEKYIDDSDDINDIMGGGEGFILPEEESCNESAGCAGVLGYKMYSERANKNDPKSVDSQRKLVRIRDDEETDKKKVEKKISEKKSNPKQDSDDDELSDEELDNFDDLNDDSDEAVEKKIKNEASPNKKPNKPANPGPAPKQAASSKAMDANMKGYSTAAKLKAGAGEVKRTAMALLKVPKAISDALHRQIEEWEQAGDDKRKQKMLEPGFRKNYYKAMRHAITYGVAFAINPLLDVLVFFVNHLNKERDARLRNELLHELEAEVRICEEKIRDADAGEDKKKKYQLMRIKDKLQAEIVRVRTNSRYI